MPGHDRHSGREQAGTLMHLLDHDCFDRQSQVPVRHFVFWQLGDHTQRMILRMRMYALVSFSLPARRPYALFFAPMWTKNDAKRKANAGWISDGCCSLEVGFVDDGRIASTASAPASKANAPAR